MAGQGGDEQLPSFALKAAKRKDQPQAHGALVSYKKTITVHLTEQQI